MAVDHLTALFSGGHHDFVGVHDDDVITGIDMWCKDWLVLATEHSSHFGAETTEDHSLSVDDVPLSGDLTRLRCVGLHYVNFQSF